MIQASWLPDDTCQGKKTIRANTPSRNTIQAEASDEDEGIQGAEIIGLTMDGGPIIHFKDAVPYSMPDSSEIIGRCSNDKPIVVCRRDGFQLIYNGTDSRAPSPNPATKPGASG
ncbi:hypothetical protein KNSL1_000986 [Colletotrichum chrysophilum]|nr:hypothetical protein KNSL1_000986 [Colletotrichum chrysophilum]